MSIFFSGLPKNLAKCFSGWNLAAHLSAIALTCCAVLSGFDWWWYEISRGIPAGFLYPALAGGGLLPMLAPFVVLAVAALRKDWRMKLVAGALGQSAFLGWLVSSAYKAFTGRNHPMFGQAITDISREFSFGFLRGGIFWGWPSSHTTVAFSVSVALAWIFRKKPVIAGLLMLWAFYVGLAVSVSIHWFSDFAAGAIIGTVIGLAVGRHFSKQLTQGGV